MESSKKQKALIFDLYGVLFGAKDSTEVLELLREKRSEGHKIGLLSNVAKYSFDKIFSKKEQEELFDEIVLSGEVHLMKPDREIFEMIAEKLGENLEDCVMIDDLEDNIASAKFAKMHGILFQNAPQLREDLNKIEEE